MNRRLALAALALCCTTGCAFLSQFLQSAFQAPTFEFSRVALTDFSLGGLTLDTRWNVRNPNTVGLTLAEVEYGLAIDGQQVVAGKPAQGLAIAPRANSELSFPAGIKFAELVGAVVAFVSKDTAHYKASGSLGLQTPIGILRFPLEKEGDFETPKLPEVRFGNPQLSNLSLMGATLSIPLTVTNKNTFPMPIAGVTGAVSIGGAQVGTLSSGDLGAMTAKGTRQVALPVTVNFLSGAAGVVNAIRQGNAQLQFSGTVQSGVTTLPLSLEQAVQFLK
jgi:LEA14-like dessication related protein